MSADFTSTNPFRRKGASPAPIPSQASTSTTPLPALSTSTSTVNHIAFQQADLPSGSEFPEASDVPKKITKKVRVQSPPPSSPSVPDSASTIDEGTYSIFIKPPTPSQRTDDPFDAVSSVIDEDEEVQKSGQVPANPFSRTLETMEHPEREEAAAVTTATSTAPARGTMDVDAFKRLLMTGNSGLGTYTPPYGQPPQSTHTPVDNGSSTDTSSISRHSMFETSYDVHVESPRTSHEISEPEDERRVIGTDFTSINTGRMKPPPPSSRHGRLIKLELRDDPTTAAAQSPNTPGSSNSQTYFNSSPRSATDLNKPLPPAPTRSSPDSDRESIFDREAAGKVPDPPSPSLSLRNKKTPPTPPLARRHSQLVSESKLTRTNSGRLSPKPEEDTASIGSVDTVEGRPRSDSARAPPPPPSRRPASIRNSSGSITLNASNASNVSNSNHPAPAPPPARGTSRSGSDRPPSITNAEGVTPVLVNRSNMAPPPPPPHRHGRKSMDGNSPGGSRRPSGETFRKSTDTARRGSTASSLNHVENFLEPEPISESSQSAHDVLADLNALQREIDALRSQPSVRQAENVT